MESRPPADAGILFHLESSYSPDVRDEEPPKPDLCPEQFRTYPGSTRVPLPVVGLDAEMPLGETLARRRSVREFEPANLPLETLARLLRLSYGVREWVRVNGEVFGRRPIPSAGGLYPLELYVSPQGVEGAPVGLYHYDARGHALELRRSGDVRARLAGLTGAPPAVLQASIVLIVAGVLRRTTWKYGLRGYRFVWIEAGHLGQNVALVAEALGLGSVSIGAFCDDDVDRLAELPEGERTLYLLAVGRPKPEDLVPPPV